MTQETRAIFIAAGYEFGNNTTQVGAKDLVTSGNPIRVTCYHAKGRRSVEISVHPHGITSMTLAFDVHPDNLSVGDIQLIEERIVRMMYHY